jgi:hypothetical protein
LNESNKVIAGHRHVYEPNLKGAGGLQCTAHDLYTFAHALSTGALISKNSLQSMFTPRHTKENHGYGCRTTSWLGHTCIEHGGMASSGFKTNVSIFINDEIYIVILSNFFHGWVNEARDALAAIILNEPYDFPSRDAIQVNSITYDDYAGSYDHPFFKSGYKIERNGATLYLPGNIELCPVANDQFIALNQNADNIVYSFIRNEKGNVIQLRIKGGGPYFELRCDKK